MFISKFCATSSFISAKTHSAGSKSCTTSSLTSPKMHSVCNKSCKTSPLTSPKTHSVHSKLCTTSSLTSPKTHSVGNKLHVHPLHLYLKYDNGGKVKQAQLYTVRSNKTDKYSNTEIIKILQKPNEFKLSQIMPVKPKGGEA